MDARAPAADPQTSGLWIPRVPAAGLCPTFVFLSERASSRLWKKKAKQGQSSALPLLCFHLQPNSANLLVPI